MITGAQIGRQQRTADNKAADEDNEYRHAFLIIEAKRGPGGSNSRHVLCAESDEERDSWVDILVRYVTGKYNDDDFTTAEPRASTSSEAPSDSPSTPTRRRNVEIAIGPAVPISQLAPDASNAKLFQSAPLPEATAASLVSQPPEEAPALSSSLPTPSPLVGGDDEESLVEQRANSEMGHYSDLADQRAVLSKPKQPAMSSPEQRRKDRRRSINPLKTSPIPERPSTPEKDMILQTPRVDANGKVKISGPMNGTPIPAGYKFGGKDAPPDAAASNDRREKAKSRSFWGFGRQQHGV
jgi:RalA-binding protein 1